MEKKNFINIKETVVNELIEAEVMTQITSRKYRGKDKNIYYGIGDAVLMRVNDENYIVLDRTIKSDIGTEVDVVAELTKFTWSTLQREDNKNCSRNHVVMQQKNLENIPSRNYLPRILMQLKMFGTVESGSLDHDYQVHHESDVYDNRMAVLKYLHKSQHTDRHNHLHGYVITSVNEFKEFYAALQAA